MEGEKSEGNLGKSVGNTGRKRTLADTSSVELGDEHVGTRSKLRRRCAYREHGLMVIASMDAHPCQLIALAARISRAGSGYFDDCALF